MGNSEESVLKLDYSPTFPSAEEFIFDWNSQKRENEDTLDANLFPAFKPEDFNEKAHTKLISEYLFTPNANDQLSRRARNKIL